MKKEKNIFQGKTVLITGGTGSFGRNFARHLLENYSLKKLIIFSRDEFKQHELRGEFEKSSKYSKANVRFFLGDVRDPGRVQRAFHGVDIVIHAAALKQVPALEYNPFEAIKTNILGTENVIEAAVDQGVSKVLFISTDKAAEPANLYGATKLCAEKLVVSANAYGGNRTEFGVVRYGNVMGSRGSIIEILLKNKGIETVNITHEEMTRFWINLPRSFELVIFALTNMKGGEIFVPKIPSMKVTHLFDVLAPKAKRNVIGVRPGEKIHEVLLTEAESRHAIELKDYFVILPEHDEFFSQDKYREISKSAKKVSHGFSYTSDTNGAWMTREDFEKVISKIVTKQL